MQLLILLNPAARVYTLRLLVIADIATIVILALGNNSKQIPFQRGLGCSTIIVLHHTLVYVGFANATGLPFKLSIPGYSNGVFKFQL